MLKRQYIGVREISFAIHSIFYAYKRGRPGLPFFASNYLMELLPNWLCWGCKASAFYHHIRTRLGRGRGGYVHVRFFQYSSGSIKSHFINHSTFLHTRFSKMYEDVIICLNFFLIFHEKYPKKDLFHRFHAVNKHFETQIWVGVSFKSPKAKGYLIKRLGKWYQGDSSELFPSTAEVFIERKGGLFFFKSLCKVSRNHLLVRKSTLAILRMTQFSDKSMEYSNVHTFAIEVSSDDHENDDVSDACHRAFTSSFIVITDENKVYHAVLGSRCIRR